MDLNPAESPHLPLTGGSFPLLWGPGIAALVWTGVDWCGLVWAGVQGIPTPGAVPHFSAVLVPFSGFPGISLLTSQAIATSRFTGISPQMANSDSSSSFSDPGSTQKDKNQGKISSHVREVYLGLCWGLWRPLQALTDAGLCCLQDNQDKTSISSGVGRAGIFPGDSLFSNCQAWRDVRQLLSQSGMSCPVLGLFWGSKWGRTTPEPLHGYSNLSLNLS